MLMVNRVLSKSFPLCTYRAWKRAIRMSRAVALWKAYRPRGPKANDPALHFEPVKMTPELYQQLRDRHPERHIPPNIGEVYLPRDPHGPLVCAYKSPKTGKTQYVYSRTHREAQTDMRMERQAAVHAAIPDLHKWADSQLRMAASDPDYARTHEAGIAAMLKIMLDTGMRVGERRRAEAGSHGAASLKPEHVHVDGDTVHIKTTGKGGREIAHQITNPHLARVVEAHLAIPHHLRSKSGFLFHAAIPNKQGGYDYKHTTADHVRRFLEHGYGIDPHDIRRYHANRTMVDALTEFGTPSSPQEAARHIREAKKRVLAALGDEHKGMLQHYLDEAHEHHHMRLAGGGQDIFSAGAGESFDRLSEGRRKLAQTMREAAEASRRSAASAQSPSPVVPSSGRRPTTGASQPGGPAGLPASASPARSGRSKKKQKAELPYVGRLFE